MSEPRDATFFPPLETFACQDDLHAFCNGSGEDEARRTVKCQCRCHRGEHIANPECWCDPYPDSVEPSVLIHRKAANA